MTQKGINIQEIKIYSKWKINLKIKNELDLLWWSLHVLDKIPTKEALKILKEVHNLIKSSKDEVLIYWFLRFAKDNNLFFLSSKVKTKIKELIKEYMIKIEELYSRERITFEKYMIREPLEIINKYW